MMGAHETVGYNEWELGKDTGDQERTKYQSAWVVDSSQHPNLSLNLRQLDEH